MQVKLSTLLGQLIKEPFSHRPMSFFYPSSTVVQRTEDSLFYYIAPLPPVYIQFRHRNQSQVTLNHSRCVNDYFVAAFVVVALLTVSPPHVLPD